MIDKYKKLRNKRLAAGMCANCGKYPVEPSKKRCKTCLEKHRRDYHSKKALSDKDACKRCFKNLINHSRSNSYCTHCLDRLLIQVKRYRLHNLDKIRKTERVNSSKYHELHRDECAKRKLDKEVYRVGRGLCKRCGKLPIDKGISKVCCTYCNKQYNRYASKRYAIKLGRTAHYSTSEWTVLCSKYENRCLWCGQDNVKLTVDHIVPLSKGGSDLIENIQPLCKPCNSRKLTKILDFRPFGSAIMDWT